MRLKHVTQSTLFAETLVLTDLCSTALLIGYLISDILQEKANPRTILKQANSP